MLIEYLIIRDYIIFSLVLGCFLLFISLIFVFQKPNSEKLSAYECGFNPYKDARSKFEVRYFLVAILFIIFDLEIVYLFPWVIILSEMSWIGFRVMLIFVFILTLGFIYEWLKKALDSE
jgi:NADH-quinone oxidoreductase subunit A